MDMIVILLIGGLVAFMLILVVLFALKGRLGTYPVPPANLLQRIRRNIQIQGFTCAETKPGVLSIHKDTFAKVKIHFRSHPKGTEVLYEIDATEIGWAVLFILVFVPSFIVPLGGFAGVAFALYIHISGRTFSRDFIGKLIHFLLTQPEPRREPVRHVLLESLADAENLLRQTKEYERSNMMSRIGLVGIGSLALWSLLFFLPVVYLEWDFLVGLLLATIVVLPILVIGIYLSARRGHKRLMKLDRWISRLITERGIAMSRGQQRIEESTINLAMEAGHLSRDLLSYLAKLELWNHPVEVTYISTSFILGFFILLPGLFLAELSWLISLTLIGIGVFFLFLGVIGAVRWKAKVTSKYEKGRIRWEERMNQLLEAREHHLRRT